MTRYPERRRAGAALCFLLLAVAACAPLPTEPGWPGLLYVPASDDAAASFIVTYIDRAHRVNARTGEAMLLPPALRSALDEDEFVWRVESCANKGSESTFANNWKGKYFAAPALNPAGDALYLASQGARGGEDALIYAQLASGEVDFGDCLPLSEGVLADLARDGDTLYIAQMDGRLQAIDLAQDFALRWQFQADEGIWAEPLLLRTAPSCAREAGAADIPLARPMLLLAALDHHLYALDLESGQEIWRRDLGGTVASPPLACWRDEQLRLYMGTFSSRVFMLDGQSGAELAEYEAKNWVWGRPALDEGGRLYFADLRGNVYRLNGELNELWVKQVAEEGIRAAPVLLGERLLVADRKGRIFLLYLDDGAVAFSEDLGRDVLSDIQVVAGEAEERPLVVFATTRRSELLRAFELDGERLRPLWVYDGG